MARYNEILVGRYARGLQKLFGVKGEVPIASLAGELVASHVVFNGAENRYLEGWQRFASIQAPNTAPAAGNRAAWRIRNPAGSNVIAVIEKFQLFAIAGADQPFIQFNNVATTLPTESTANVGSTNLDARGQQLAATCIISASVNFGLVGTFNWQISMPASSNLDMIFTDVQEIALSPGQELTVVSNILAQANVAVNLMWRERFLEESERA